VEGHRRKDSLEEEKEMIRETNIGGNSGN